MIFREFCRWLIEHTVPRSKMDSSQKGSRKNLQPEKGRTEEHEAEDSYPNTKSKFRAQFPDLSQISDAD